MAKSIEITLTGKLADHVRQQTSEHGLYQDASDYIRALIRKDLESEEDGWDFLADELAPALAATDADFVAVTADDVINRNRDR